MDHDRRQVGFHCMRDENITQNRPATKRFEENFKSAKRSAFQQGSKHGIKKDPAKGTIQNKIS
jgi:hypothetical protein